MSNIKWDDIQRKYDDEKISERKICELYGISSSTIHRAKKEGLFKTRDKSELIKIFTEKSSNKKMSQETKDKISISRKEYLRNNPDKVPYLLNHSRNESYPEKYFSDIFEKEGLIVEKAVRIGLYELDFSVPSKRIDIEIDGSQHYCDKKILESDIRRNEFLEQNGWDIIRINWSNYQKMSFDEKKEYIRNLISYINDISTSKPSIPFIKHIRGKNLCMCGELKYTRSKSCKDCRTKIEKVDKKRDKKRHKAVKKRYDKQILCSTCGNISTKGRCIKCYQLGSRKVERPTYEDLLKDISDLGYCGTGRKYGVTDNSIRKWIKNYNR